ncbi:unnamed protein product [Hydatigera taeniaeformis]|uniref:Robl_LC7 domain-containing protein n=1 Tax=Hydatigena taeniaeformis TaxID=6205 RepID=A0A0R3WQD4_HYDTA|nr:unnamed protein product [Hydatigera taeniaeformis]
MKVRSSKIMQQVNADPPVVVTACVVVTTQLESGLTVVGVVEAKSTSLSAVASLLRIGGPTVATKGFEGDATTAGVGVADLEAGESSSSVIVAEDGNGVVSIGARTDDSFVMLVRAVGQPLEAAISGACVALLVVVCRDSTT